MANSLRDMLEGSLVWKQEPRTCGSVTFPAAAAHDDRKEDFIRDEDLPALPSEQYNSVWEAILACL